MDTSAGIVRMGTEYDGGWSFPENSELHGADWNNIIDGVDKEWPSHNDFDWGTITGLNAFYPRGSRDEHSSPDFSEYFVSDNYMYRPDDPDQFVVNYPAVYYTLSEFEAQALTHIPRDQYSLAYDGGDLLYEDTSGADKYITRGAHVVEGAVTIADGGVGGNHPYLSGVTIPSYVGATDPSDISTNHWVEGLLDDLTSTAWLRSMSTDRDGNDDPDWIAGSEGGGGASENVFEGCTPTGLVINQ